MNTKVINQLRTDTKCYLPALVLLLCTERQTSSMNRLVEHQVNELNGANHFSSQLFEKIIFTIDA